MSYEFEVAIYVDVCGSFLAGRCNPRLFGMLVEYKTSPPLVRFSFLAVLLAAARTKERG